MSSPKIYQVANLQSSLSDRVLKAGDTMTGNLNVAATLITQNVIPDANVTYDLGTSTARFKDLWLSNSTIYLGEASISAQGGNVSFGNAEIQLSNVSTKLNVTNDLFVSGNVGIGTTSPSYKLQVIGGSSDNNNDANAIVVDGTNHVRLKINTPTSGGFRSSLVLSSNAALNITNNEVSISTTGANEMQFLTGGSERMRLDSSGNFGIGTSSPDGRLHVLNGSAGAVVANGNADDLVVENSATGGLSILTPDASTGYIIFGSPSDNEGAIIRYSQSGANMTIGTEIAGGQLLFRTGSGSERLRIDASGNLGLGVTPSAWGTGSSVRALQLNGGALSNFSTSAIALSGNAFFDGSNWKYVITRGASQYEQNNGVHAWYTAASGTAGANISFTQAMTLNASGNLGIGTTSPSYPLHIVKNAGGQQAVFFSNDNTGVSAATAFIASNGTNEIRLLRAGTNYSSYGAFTSNDGAVYSDHSIVLMADNASGIVKFATGGNSEKARLDANGNLGIGTTSPGTRLEIASNSPTFRLTDTTSVVQGGVWGAIEWKGSDGSLGVSGYITGKIDVVDEVAGGAFYGDRGAMRFFTNNSSALTERGRFTAGGYFKASYNGSYVSSTAGWHEFVGGASDWTLRLLNTSGTTPYGLVIQYNSVAPNDTGKEFFYCYDSTALRAAIRSNGGIANYQGNDVNLSDERVKKDVTPLESMWDKFKAIEIVKFKYKDQTHDDDNIGVIAQQVESIAPEFVDNDGFGETPEDGVPLKTVYTTDMYHAAIKALQEAMARIEQLEAKVASLEAK